MIDVHVTTSQLGDLLGALAHPHRLLIVWALREGETEAPKLAAAVGLSPLGVVEHLRVLRTHRVVREVRVDGRGTWELTWPGIVDWLGVGASFIEGHRAPTPGRLVELPKAGRA